MANQPTYDVIIVVGQAGLDSLKKLFHAHPDAEGGFEFSDQECAG